MKIALFFALLLIQGCCSQFINKFTRNLCYGFCGPIKMRPTGLFEGFVREIAFPVTDGTNVDKSCVDSVPVFTITCKPGLYLSNGSQSKTIKCQDENCPEFENCKAITCAATPISNANVTELPSSSYKATVDVGCDTDHTLPDGSSTSYMAECQVSGQWSQTDSCLTTNCPITALSNTKLHGGMLPRLPYPMELRVECEDGYRDPNRDSFYVTKCESSGAWSKTDSCEAIKCPQTDITNSVEGSLQETAFPGMRTITCSTGFKLSNGMDGYTSTCQADGTWNQIETCIVDGRSAGYKYLPRTGKFYKNVKPMNRIAYTTAATACTTDHPDAVVAPAPEPDILWLLNNTESFRWVDAMQNDSNKPWLMSNGSEITTFYWCIGKPDFRQLTSNLNLRLCIEVHNYCWLDRDCSLPVDGVVCQLG